MTTKAIPGTIYLNNGRYYWRVKFSNDSKRQAIPLKPKGAKHATRDPEVAKEVAKMIYHQYLFDKEQGDNTKSKGRVSRKKNPQTIAELSSRYVKFAKGYYTSNEPVSIQYALKWLIEMHAATPINDFSPVDLKDVRVAMIKDDLCRNVINQRVNIIKRMFRWAVSETLCHPNTLSALEAVTGLRKRKKERGTEPRETEKVKPVPAEHIEKTIEQAPPTIQTMIELQLLTGMRSSELCNMKPGLINRTGEIWFYYPDRYKGDHIDGYEEKIIPLGPKAQAILAPYLLRPDNSYCFTPKEAHKQRTGNKGCSKAVKYDRLTYRRAVQYAIAQANKSIQAECQTDDEYQVKKIKWTPHQLRHNRGTIIRKKMGLEASKAALGHRHLNSTEIYAEQDFQKAIEAARRFG